MSKVYKVYLVVTGRGIPGQFIMNRPATEWYVVRQDATDSGIAGFSVESGPHPSRQQAEGAAERLQPGWKKQQEILASY